MSEIEKKSPRSLLSLLLTILLVVGIFLGCSLLGAILYKTTRNLRDRSAYTIGIYEETVKAQSALLSFRVLVDEKSPALIYQKMKKNLEIVMNFLMKQGCSKKEITALQSMTYNNGTISKESRNSGVMAFQIRTNRVDAMNDLHNAIVQLAEYGMKLDQITLHYAYHWTKDKQNDLFKKALWASQSKAKYLAEESHLKVSGFRSVSEMFMEVRNTDISSKGTANHDDSLPLSIDERNLLYKKLHICLSATWNMKPQE